LRESRFSYAKVAKGGERFDIMQRARMWGEVVVGR
jgi:hypothetical protein